MEGSTDIVFVAPELAGIEGGIEGRLVLKQRRFPMAPTARRIFVDPVVDRALNHEQIAVLAGEKVGQIFQA